VKPKCIEAVNKAAVAAGRKALTAAEIRAIDDRLARTMRYLARRDAAWHNKSGDQRVMEASKLAFEELQAEAKRKVANAQLQILRTKQVEERLKAWVASGKTRSASFVRDIELTQDYITGVKHEAVSHLMDLVDAAKSGEGAGVGRHVSMFLFDVQNPAMTRDLAREIYAKADGSTGNEIAQKGAKAWLQEIEALRQRFNAGGGDVKRIAYGYLPPAHDALRVGRAGIDRWISETMPLLDRSAYLNEAGAPLTDAELREVLATSYRAISSDGLTEDVLGIERGPGVRANRGREHRELHFKGADEWLAYTHAFGSGSMYDLMIGHIGRIARDIGLVERYGPNPAAQARLQFDTAAHAIGKSVDELPGVMGLHPEKYWNQVSGITSTPKSARLAQIGSAVRNLQTAGKLASAVLASVTDLGTYIVTTGYNRLPYWRAITNIGRTVASRDARDFLTSHGIIAESMAGDLNRWTADNIKATWSGRLANATLRLSLLNAWTDSLRRAFSLTMMQGLARMAGKDWDGLHEWDRTRLQHSGITSDDWAVIRRAELTHFQGLDHLTPDAIRATGDERAPEVVAKVLGLITDESEHAVLNPDMAAKIWANGGLQRGTGWGELVRSIMQFKSFPIAMVTRHWTRMLEGNHVSDGSAPLLANRLAYGAAMMVTLTGLGAIAAQAKQITSGKDPVDMTGRHAVQFWLKAFAQGGGASIAGDFLANDPGASVGDFARNFGGTLMGPALSTVGQAVAIPLVNAWDAAKGKKTHTAAEEVQLLRQNAPFVNIWYAKAALDHMGMHALQETLSPGYLARMRQRAAQDWGQRFWWEPGTGGPERAPDIGKAVGQ